MLNSIPRHIHHNIRKVKCKYIIYNNVSRNNFKFIKFTKIREKHHKNCKLSLGGVQTSHFCVIPREQRDRGNLIVLRTSMSFGFRICYAQYTQIATPVCALVRNDTCGVRLFVGTGLRTVRPSHSGGPSRTPVPTFAKLSFSIS